MRLGLWRYVKAAFNARPFGMFVAPNWIGLIAVALLGFIDWGFWVLGAGLELAYLFVLVQSPGFRQIVESRERGALPSPGAGASEAIGRLDLELRGRYERLRARCLRLLGEQPEDAAGLEVQRASLERLLWLFLKLLRTRQTVQSLLHEAAASGYDEARLSGRIASLERQLASAPAGALRTSIETQIELLHQRGARQADARVKLAQVDLELERIEQQVELLREELVLSTSGETVSLRIEAVSSSLNEAMQWVRGQDDPSGAVEELSEEVPRLLGDPRDERSTQRS
jgi:hypothetical protein